MCKLFSSLLIVLFLFSCGQKKDSAAVVSQTGIQVNKTDSFFPVTSYLKGQLRIIDSLPVSPLHTVTINHKTDSFWIKREALRPLLQFFLTPEITETNLISLFKQTSFNDLTLNAFTLTYDPIDKLPDTMQLQHWDIYIDPDKGSVSKIYLVKTDKKNKLTYQLTWQSDKRAKIITILHQSTGNDTVIKEEQFVWDF